MGGTIQNGTLVKYFSERGLTRCSIVEHPKDNDIQPWTLAVMHRIDSIDLNLIASAQTEMAMGFGASIITTTTGTTTTMPDRAGTG